ncbi:hypothetical protein I7E32_05995 [Alcaligenes faecalis]|uniref:hypothetical protein n=1 Tax=Alcaligenes faecalis TaxID=511 RepID=UPI0018D0735C|nr:hypothetical protein [Alcaligenes faecalis]MBH0309919.1 hypothetical protein [Alcaligenes faecalis]
MDQHGIASLSVYGFYDFDIQTALNKALQTHDKRYQNPRQIPLKHEDQGFSQNAQRLNKAHSNQPTPTPGNTKRKKPALRRVFLQADYKRYQEAAGAAGPP